MNRRGRVAIAILAVTVGATLAASLLTVSIGAEGAAEKELRGYGANILVTPKDSVLQVGSGSLGFGSVSGGKLLSEDSLMAIGRIIPKDRLVGYTPYLFSIANVGPDTVVVAGTSLDEVRKVNPWWKVEGGGKWIENQSSLTEIMVGKNLAEKIGIKQDGMLTISRDSSNVRVKVVGVVSTGGSEDNQIVGTLRFAQTLAGEPGSIHLVWVSVLAQGGDLEHVAQMIEQQVPGSEAKTISQIAQSEEIVLSRMQFTMILVTLLVLSTSGLGVMCTMSTSIMERRREIGLLKALGAEDRRISLLHFTEASLIGLAGGLAGYIVGTVLAALIGLQIYGKMLPPQPFVLLITLLISLGLVWAASIVPVRSTLRVESAVVLRGE
ncbi:MAG: FtsX-like permease family protein [Thaumarchaeota archaeon]|nr:FtsX-like permease family protein [Nitrososphaerota archaeon]